MIICNIEMRGGYNKMAKVKVGLIGVGWMGSELGRNIVKNPNAELVAVANRREESVKRFKKDTGSNPMYYKDYQELLKNPDIEAVIISTPNNTHKEITIAAAEAGKHIMCEKPMAITLDDCKKIKEAVTKTGVKYLIGYHCRFNPLYNYAKNILDSGDMGEPYFIESDYIHYIPSDWAIWDWLGKEDIAGSLFHAGCGHNVDLMRYICGDISEVSCFKDIFVPRKVQVETEDTAVAIFRFEKGAIGKIILGIGAISPFTFTFSLYGTKATIRNNKVWFDWIPNFYEVGYEKDCITLPESWIPNNELGHISEPWDKEINHFIDAIKNNKHVINDVESAYKTSEVSFAVIKSAVEKKVIKLPLE